MSTKTVFSVNVADNSQSVEAIIQSFLKNNSFTYNKQQCCYMVGTPSESDANLIMVANIATNAAQPYLKSYTSSGHPCFEYSINGANLIIKAFYLYDFAGIKRAISDHNIERSAYYGLIKEQVVGAIETDGGKLLATTVEHIADGSSSKLLKKVLLFVLPVVLVFAAITLIAYFSSR